jgi:hypothetical protein
MAYVKKTSQEIVELSANRALTQEMQVVKLFEKSAYVVVNQPMDKAYEVSLWGGKIVRCSCPHNQNRQLPCKHMFAVQFQENLAILGQG